MIQRLMNFFAPEPASDANPPGFLRTPRLALQNFDPVILWVPIFLMLLGLVMVFSASIALPGSPKFKDYSSYSFVFRQFISLVLGFFVAVFGFRLPSKDWEKIAPLLFIFTMFLLVLVLIPGVGRSVGGARRWLPLGIMNLQPSELMKIACALYAASYCVRKQGALEHFKSGILPIAIVVVLTGGLLMGEPDLGAFMVIFAVTMGVVFLGGVNAKMFAGMAGVAAVGFVTLVLAFPFRRARLFAYLDPWSKDHAEGKAYQLTQSLIAFGRGELWGVGLGDSVQKMFYLPEAHTDFILAVIGEEFGFIGVTVVIGAFTILVHRMFRIAREALVFERNFQALAVQGLGIWFGVQSFINIGVNLGLLPTKGLTLPFVSYGGSAILMNCLAIAFVLRVDYENRCLMRGEKL
jgi:cell division protein FtsW